MAGVAVNNAHIGLAQRNRLRDLTGMQGSDGNRHIGVLATETLQGIRQCANSQGRDHEDSELGLFGVAQCTCQTPH